MVVLDNCCCCIPLKVGCLIIGYFYVIINSLGVLAGLVLAIYGIVLNNQEIDPTDKTAQHAEDAIQTLIIILSLGLIIGAAINLTISTLFVVGLHKNKRGFVLVFLICKLLTLIGTCLGALGSFVTLDPITSIAALINLAIDVYVFLVIKSHYDIMGEENGKIYSY